MSSYQIAIIDLDCALPADNVISSAIFSSAYQATDIKKRAESVAAGIVNSARRKACAIVREARQQQNALLASTKESQQQIIDETVNRCESQWLKKHVAQLRQWEELEQGLVQSMSFCIKESIKAVLTAWFDEQQVSDVLCDRLTKKVQLLAPLGALTLHIHPDMEKRARREFGDRLTIVTHPDFIPDKAILSSPQISITFSPSRHFQQLIGWLQAEEEQSCEDL